MKNNRRNGLMVCMVLVFLTGFSGAAYSASDAAKLTAPVADKGISEADRNLVASQIEGFKQLEIRILVLQQVVSEQVAILQQRQALFCDVYKLNVEKMRKGLYQYDTKTGKFSEAQLSTKAADSAKT